jgi:competence protein ComEC
MVTLAPLGRIGAALLIVVCAGGARHAAYDAPSPRALEPVAAAAHDALTLNGTVHDAPERSGSDTRFTVAADTVFGAGDTTAVDGQVRVTLRPSPWEESPGRFPRLYEGDRVQLRGEVRPAPGQRNPGGFDYGAYLSRRGTCCTMYVGDPSNVTRLNRERGLLTGFVVGVRSHVRRQVLRYVPSDDGQAVLQALLLGDRSRITDAQRERFARTGLMHLLAVSGLHVFLVGMVLYLLLRPLLMRFRLGWRTVEVSRAVLTVVVLGVYMLLTGARPSVVRAVVMSALFIGGVVFQRSAHPLNTLGVAAVVLLAVRPPAIFDVGFQLSMAAVAGIVTLNPRLLDLVPEGYQESSVGDWLVSMVTVSLAAMLGTAPVLLYHFGWVSAAGLLLNVVGIPCTGLALSAAVAMEGVGGVWPTGAAAFGSTADLFVQGLLLTSRLGTEWFSWAGLRVANPSVWTLGALAAALVGVAQWPRPRLRWRCLACALLLAASGVWMGAVGRSAGPTMDVIFFDVGQGDAALVSTPAGKHVLVDTGPRSFGGGSAATYSVLPYLEQHGIHHLDAVVITHPDGDHLGGLPSVLKAVSVDRVLHSGQKVGTDLYAETRRLIDRSGVSERAVDRGDVFRIGAVRMQVLGPPVRPSRHGIESENGRSVVLHLAYGEADVLLPGDVEADAERALVRAYGNRLASRVVKIPHHGSGTSSTQSFVEAAVDTARGTKAVVSVGQSNRFGMPDGDVLGRWKSSGASVSSTAQAGAVWLRSDGEDVWRVRWD